MRPTVWHGMTFLVLQLGSWTAWSQVFQQEEKTVVVNGQTGDVRAIQISGETYVDLESLVRAGGGSVSFQGHRIVLTLPAPHDSVASTNDSGNALSRDFVKSGIEEISLLREWATPLAMAMQNGYPISEALVTAYQRKAEDGLRVASASVTSDADRNAIHLLTNEFEAVRQWSDHLLEARKSMSAANYAVSEDALQNDPLSQKIMTCAHFLGPMLASGSFQDDPSCH